MAKTRALESVARNQGSGKFARENCLAVVAGPVLNRLPLPPICRIVRQMNPFCS